MILGGANTYACNLTINAGTVRISNKSNTANDTSTVTIAASGATLDLTYIGTDAVDKLVIDTTEQPAGIYGKLGSVSPIIGISQITGDGTLTVGAGSSNFASWANDPLKGNIPGEPANGDFDNDGIPNIIEYALGLDPRVSSQPAGTFSGNTITYTKGADAIANGDVSWVIETSETLVSGSWIAEPVVPGDTISYTFTPGNPAKKFARLKVTQIP
jgi:autotransporter-associated beta strand protein